MCLSSVSLNLNVYDKSVKDFIGYGYKKLHIDVIKKYGNKWNKATGSTDNDDTSLEDEGVIKASDNQEYYPGFHIFLNKENAENYAGNHISSWRKVVKVAFRGVLTFGFNKAGTAKGLCVVTKYMKVLPEDKQD